MILTKDKILEEIKKKNISITPFYKRNIGPASIDLTLSNAFHIFPHTNKILLSEKSSAENITLVKRQKKITLLPGDFILGMTKEKISLPQNICGLLSGRSRFARMGLLIDATAFFVHPGVSNRQVFEIKNISSNTITLSEGLRIAQLIFLRTEGKAKYSGRFKRQ